MIVLFYITMIAIPFFFGVFDATAFNYASHHSRFTKLNCHSYSNNRAIFAAGRHCYNVFFLYGKGIRIGNTFDLTARHYLDDIIFMLNQVEIFHCWWKLIERIIFKVEVNIGLSKLLHIRNDFLIKPSSIFIIFWNSPLRYSARLALNRNCWIGIHRHLNNTSQSTIWGWGWSSPLGRFCDL